MTMQEMLQSRYAAIEQAKAVRDKAKFEHRELTESEVAAIEGHLAVAEGLTNAIDAQNGKSHEPLGGTVDERVDQAWAVGNEPVGVPRAVLPTLDSGPGSSAIPQPRFVRGNKSGSMAARLFGDARGQNGGFKSFGDFLGTLDSGRFDNRIHAAMKTGILSDGGAMVPSEYRNVLLDAILEDTILLKRCTIYPMASDTLHLNSWDGNTHTSRSLFGGFTANWETEAATMTPQDAATRRITLVAKKLAILSQSSNELLADGRNYEEMLGTAMAQATSWELDYQLLQGTGAGRPLGVLNAGSAITVSAEASQTASTVWYVNLVKMFSRLHPSCYANAIWICNPQCIVELFQLDYHAHLGSGSSLIGDDRYEAFREVDGRFTLFGRPVYPTEKAPALGAAGCIVLVDPSQICFGLRAEIRVEKSSHAGFTSDTSYFRVICRCDASPAWAKVFTPAAGDTLSWAVLLGATA